MTRSNPTHLLTTLAFTLLLLTIPWPLYLPILTRAYPPVYIEHTSLNLYIADAAVLLLLFSLYK